MKTKLLRKIRAKLAWKFQKNTSNTWRVMEKDKIDVYSIQTTELFLIKCLTVIGYQHIFITNKRRMLNRLTKAQKNKKIQDWLNS